MAKLTIRKNYTKEKEIEVEDWMLEPGHKVDLENHILDISIDMDDDTSIPYLWDSTEVTDEQDEEIFWQS